MSIRSKIFIAFAFVFAIAGFELLQFTLENIKPHYREASEEVLVETSALLASWLAAAGEGDELPLGTLRKLSDNLTSLHLNATIYEMRKDRSDLRLYVTDPKGIVLFDSLRRDEGKDFSQWRDVRLTLSGRYGARSTKDRPEDQNSTVLYVASPIVRKGALIGVVSVGKPVIDANRFIERMRSRTITYGAGIFALYITLGLLASFFIARPIRKLTKYANAVATGEHPPLPRLGGGEIGALGNAFENMLVAIEGRKYIESYVLALTHAIKSPLAALRASAELLEEDLPEDKRREFLAGILEQGQRIEELVKRLLSLAAVEAKSSLEREEDLSLADAARDAAAELRPLGEERDIEISVTGDAGRMTGDVFMLREAIRNLVLNALEFSPARSRIQIAVEEKGGQVLLTVDDEGPGIPDYAQDRIFERFYSLPRPATGKKSSGLGLSFVREAAKLHHGEAILTNRPQGGARAELHFSR